MNQAEPAEPDREGWSQGTGMKLRRRRKIKGLSLKAVAQKSGVSVGLLSQVERGVSVPSIRSLSSICQALDMPMAWLFERPDSLALVEPYIVRRERRRRMDLGAKGMVKEILSPDSISQIQLMRFVIHAGGRSGDSPSPHPTGAKCGTVISGCLALQIDGRDYFLDPGDSFAFRATSQYRFWAHGKLDCEVLWVVTPSIY